MSALHMVRLRIQAERLLRAGLGRGREPDPGYLVHQALTGLFGELAPHPFALTSLELARDRAIEVLGYTAADAPTLAEHATRFADPALYAACDWTALAARPMPATWPVGLTLGFELRACPVVRCSPTVAHPERKAREIDAFLARCAEAGPDAAVSREAVYRAWLEAQLTRLGAARLRSVRLTGFQRARLFRQTQGQERQGRRIERPDAVFSGELEITDAGLFPELLRRGVGRHRAFGFGMLLLRPASAPC